MGNYHWYYPMHFRNEWQAYSGSLIFVVARSLPKFFICFWQEFEVHDNSVYRSFEYFVARNTVNIPGAIIIKLSFCFIASSSQSCSTSDTVGSSKLKSSLPMRLARECIVDGKNMPPFSNQAHSLRVPLCACFGDWFGYALSKNRSDPFSALEIRDYHLNCQRLIIVLHCVQ